MYCKPIDKDKIIKSIKDHNITECTRDNILLIRRDTCEGARAIQLVLLDYLNTKSCK